MSATVLSLGERSTQRRKCATAPSSSTHGHPTPSTANQNSCCSLLFHAAMQAVSLCAQRRPFVAQSNHTARALRVHGEGAREGPPSGWMARPQWGLLTAPCPHPNKPAAVHHVEEPARPMQAAGLLVGLAASAALVLGAGPAAAASNAKLPPLDTGGWVACAGCLVAVPIRERGAASRQGGGRACVCKPAHHAARHHHTRRGGLKSCG